MNKPMRSTFDRLRHTFFFELILLLLCVPIISTVLDKPVDKVGPLSITLSVLCAFLNFAYNYVFDQVLLRLDRPLHDRSKTLRIIHALLFEATIICFTLPIVMYWMNVSFLYAFSVDLGFIIFVPIYAFCYNIAYDKVFPLTAPATVSSHIPARQ